MTLLQDDRQLTHLSNPTLYSCDYAAWVEQTVTLLRDR